MKDFSKERQQIQFRIDEDTFHAAPAIPAETLTQFVVRFSDVEGLPVNQRVSVLTEVLELILLPDSFKTLRARMNDPANPVDLEQLNELIVWLLGEYGLRPTQPSSPLPDGPPPPVSGTSSMDAVQPGASSSALFPRIVS